jgi:hypothetical protein
MFRVLAQLLDDTPCKVMHNGAFSRTMHPNMGWEQGDTLATTMFNGGNMLHGHIRHTTVALPIRRGPV